MMEAKSILANLVGGQEYAPQKPSRIMKLEKKVRQGLKQDKASSQEGAVGLRREIAIRVETDVIFRLLIQSWRSM